MVAVVLSTYNPPGGERDKYAIETIQSLVDNLKCSGPCLFRLILADDGSEDASYLREVANIAQDGWGTESVITSVNRMGIGGSLNAALQKVAFAEFWMYSTDDWVLTKELDIQSALRLIREGDYDYVRLSPLHPGLHCNTAFNEELGWWLNLHHKKGGFCFGTRPFVATKTFYNTIGLFKEYTDAYEMESDYAHRVSINSDVMLAALMDLHGPWTHIGAQQVGRIIPVALQRVVVANA